jgi:hypothetical protein
MQNWGIIMSRTATFLCAVFALTLPLALGAQTLDLPQRKAGLWEIAMEGVAGTSMKSLMCIDAEIDREMMDYTLKSLGQDCKNALKRERSTYTVDSECMIGGVATKAKTVISGDFSSAYTVRIEGTMEGGTVKGKQPILVTQTAKWKGADCAGMKPGDVSLPGGIKINIKQLKSVPAGGMR